MDFINLEEEISKLYNIQVVAWVLIYSKCWEQNEKIRKTYSWPRKGSHVKLQPRMMLFLRRIMPIKKPSTLHQDNRKQNLRLEGITGISKSPAITRVPKGKLLI